MAKKAKIYTRTGDAGETGLVGGQRRKKSDDLIELYGTCDELNSQIGVLACEINEKLCSSIKLKEQFLFLMSIQSRLFDLGSLLACLKEERERFSLPLVTKDAVKSLESEIDKMDENLPMMTNFILPGGHKASAYAHVCRTVCRRLERMMVLREEDKNDIPHHSLAFINRLSDYFFSLARLINSELKIEEVKWIPNKN